MKPKHSNVTPPPTIRDEQNAKFVQMRAEADGAPLDALLFIAIFGIIVPMVGTMHVWGQQVADLIINLF